MGVFMQFNGLIHAEGNDVGENLLLNSSFTNDYTKWSKESSGWELVNEDGFLCAHVITALQTTRHCYQNVLPRIDTTGTSTVYTVSGWIKCKNLVKGTTNPMCEYYFGGSYNDNGTSRWLGATTVSGKYNFWDISDAGWVYRTWVMRFNQIPTVMNFNIYFRDATGDLYFRDLKLEKGSVATPWIPNPNDDIYTDAENGFFEDNAIASISKGYVCSNEFYEL